MNGNAPGDRTAALDVVVIGAGFAGLYLLHRLRRLGLNTVVLEAAGGVGGTWYWNRYPGARCDVESLEYSYSFDEGLQQDWRWSERYAAQPEILAYLDHVADRFDLRRDIRLHTRVTDAEFDPSSGLWTVATQAGERFVARWCVMATGCLSSAKVPDLPGLGSFAGRWYHTGMWPTEPVDFTGRRVAVIGTGSTGIQAIPIIAKRAAHLTVFQRTANYSIPLRNGPLDPAYEADFKSRYAQIRDRARHSPSGVAGFEVPSRAALAATPEERERAFQAKWDFGGIGFTRAFNDVLFHEEANRIAREFVVPRMLAPVEDPGVAARLTPGYRIGTKRLCADTGYFETYNRPNVTLVDISERPIERIVPEGLQVGPDVHAIDTIVFATGFDAITGALLGVNPRVRGGTDLRTRWASGPRAYLGVMTAGLPNLFMVTGPGSPSVLSNVVVSIEQHVEWIGDCIDAMRREGLDRIEATVSAEDAWTAHVDEVSRTSLLAEAASWYTGANVPGKPRVFMPYMGGVGAFRKKCSAVAAQGYVGFERSRGAWNA
jgi:cyclohexanone monooxygenase